MKELETFRKFLVEGNLEENANPAVIDFLKRLQPEEVPGSWDDINHRFTVPYNYENLDHSEEDVEDFLYKTGLTLADLPTEYIEIANYPVGDENFPITARNFAKFVPGKGLMYKFTTEEG